MPEQDRAKEDKPTVIAQPKPSYYIINIKIAIDPAVDKNQMGENFRQLLKEAIAEAPDGVAIESLKCIAESTIDPLGVFSYIKPIFEYSKGDLVE